MIDLLTASATKITQAIQNGELSAVQVTEFFMNRAKSLNSKTGAFISFNENAIEEAKKIDLKIEKAEKVGSLAGVPVGVKDLLCDEGGRTTAASKILENFIAPYDATVVARLREQDAIILGKTNLDEFAMGSSNENSYFGNVKNPWDVSRVPGGSSGGSAAAVAARQCPVAIGTDTGGSIRQPASFCGVAGFKPTYGSVSRFGIVAFASSLDQAGPIANYTEDCELVLKVISGRDQADETSSDINLFDDFKDKDISGLKLGVPTEYFNDDLNAEIKSIFQKNIDTLKKQGAEIIEIELPHLEYAVATYYVVATAEASSNLSRYDGVRFGHRSETAESIEQVYSRSRSEGFGDEVKRRVLLGTFALSSGYYDEYYNKACKVRRLIHDDFIAGFKKCDLMLSPVTADPAFKIGEKVNDPMKMYLNDIYTISANLAGIPAMSVNAGFTEAGLPVGLQVMGSHNRDLSVLSLAKKIELTFNNNDRRPDVF